LTKRITLDSNVLQFCFVPPDVVDKRRQDEWKIYHPRAKLFWDAVIKGRVKLVTPFIVLAEIAVVYAKIRATQYRTKSTLAELTPIIEQAKRAAREKMKSNEGSIIYRLEELVGTSNDVVISNSSLLSQAIAIAADDQGQEVVELVCSTASEILPFDSNIFPDCVSMATKGQLRTADACIAASSLQASAVLVTADITFHENAVKNLKDVIPNIESRIINFRMMSDEDIKSFLGME
jgi:predicted nucleic acid-binding protein